MSDNVMKHGRLVLYNIKYWDHDLSRWNEYFESPWGKMWNVKSYKRSTICYDINTEVIFENDTPIIIVAKSTCQPLLIKENDYLLCITPLGKAWVPKRFVRLTCD